MAKLKGVIASMDEVPEGLREFYTAADDGSFRMDIDVADNLASVAQHNKKLLGEKKRLQAVELMLEGHGLSVDELDAFLATRSKDKDEDSEVEPPDGKKLKVKDAVAAAVAQVQAEFKKREEKLTGDLGKMRQFVEDFLVESETTRALAEAKGSTKLLLPHIRQRVMVEEEEPFRFAVRVRDEEGRARLSGVDGKPFTLSALVAEMRGEKDFASAFEGSGGSGSGAPAGNGNLGGAGSIRSLKDFTSDADKAAFIGKQGLEAFKALPPS